MYFNPRPRVEGDTRCVNVTYYDAHFNPRPRVEGDLLACAQAPDAWISILALVWRATGAEVKCGTFTDISILALVWRATDLIVLADFIL